MTVLGTTIWEQSTGDRDAHSVQRVAGDVAAYHASAEWKAMNGLIFIAAMKFLRDKYECAPFSGEAMRECVEQAICLWAETSYQVGKIEQAKESSQ